MSKIDLVKVIKENPNCVVTIDNDFWCINRPSPDNWDEMSDEEQNDWDEKSELVCSWNDIIQRGSGYGSGNCYGGDILQALAEIVGIKIESV